MNLDRFENALSGIEAMLNRKANKKSIGFSLLEDCRTAETKEQKERTSEDLIDFIMNSLRRTPSRFRCACKLREALDS